MQFSRSLLGDSPVVGSPYNLVTTGFIQLTQPQRNAKVDIEHNFMQPERWRRIDQLFHLALEKQRDERELFLAEVCAGDAVLQKEVEDLILSHERAEDFIESPASDLAADVLGKGQVGFKFGDQIGPYEIQSVLGIGGMGEVYLASDTRLGRQVALKILPPRFTLDPERVSRFEKEARAASALNHPNIVTIHEVGHFNNARFIVTEFVEGHTLRQLMNERPFTLNETLNVTIQVAVALTSAHTAGIVHRDIKPENIMLRADGYVKILDFGLAKLTEAQTSDSDPETPTLLKSSPGLLMGTVQYMSPEQARGRTVDTRTDIWSLGIVLYELVAGHVPFSGETPSHVMVSLMEDELPSLKGEANVPAELDRIVCKALRKNRKERYPAANQIARDLNQLKQELQRGDRKGLLDAVPGEGFINGRATGAPASAMGTATVVTLPQTRFSLSKISELRFAGLLTAVALILVFATAVVYRLKWAGSVGVQSEAIGPLAVLPFRSSTTNTEEITGNIIAGLSQVPGLEVTSFNDVLRYRDKPKTPVNVARELNVRVLLTGTLTINGNEAWVSTQLLDVKDNKHLDDRYYRDEVKNIPWIRSQIVKDVVGALRRVTAGLPSNPHQPADIPIQAELIPIPGGTFEMGRNDSDALERPAHKVTVPAFEMDKTEVTNAEYGQFVQQTNHLPPEYWGSVQPPLGSELLPVTDVSYADAVAFAEWRSKNDGVIYRLPTEEEWEYAARNGAQNNLYPWGDTVLADRAVTREVTVMYMRVGTFPLGANRWGVQDLIGNVWEWTSSEASMYKGSSAKLPAQARGWRVMRGGGSFSPITKVSSTTREFVPKFGSRTIGFRLVKVVSNSS